MAKNNKDPKITLKAEDKTAKAFKSAQNNLRNLASSAAVLEGPLGQVAGRINAVGAAIGRMNPAVLIAGVGLASLAVILQKSISAAGEYEAAMIRIDGVLKATGNSAGLTADAIDEMAFSIAKDTLASQEDTRRAATALLTYANVAGESFERIMRLSQDYAAVFGGNLVRATVKFGRAFDDPSRGLESLAEKITAFDKKTRDMIVAMQQAGDLAGAQAEIFRVLDETIGGVGGGQGLAFSIDTLGENWTKLLQVIGESSGAKSIAQSFFDTLAQGVENVTQWIDPSLEQQLIAVNHQVQALEKSMNRVASQPGGAESSVFDQLRESWREAKQEQDRLTASVQRMKKAEEEAEEAGRRKRAETEAKKKAYERETRALEILRQQMKEGAKVTLASRDANDIFEDGIYSLNRLFQVGAVSVETYERAVAKLKKELDKSKKTPGLGEVDRFLQTEEENIKASYDRRMAIVTEAYKKLEPTELTAIKSILDKAKALRGKYVQDMRMLRVQQGVDIAQDLASVMSSLASIEQTKSQSRLAQVEEDARRRADIVQEQLDSGLISEAEANAKLKKIEADRQRNSEAGAKKSFENSKKLQRAAAIVNTAAAVTLTLSDISIQPFFARVAAAAAIAASGAAQIASINAASFNGGGSIPGVGGSFGNTPGQLPALPNEDRGSVTIQFIGDQYGWDEYMEEKVINGIRDAVDNRDVTIIGRSSRQFQELQE